MAAQIVHILKQSGDFWVRQANDNLQIPGFKQLDGCSTTVDMDVDPEVFVMLEPVHIRGLGVSPHYDMYCCARRLRTILTTTMLFFRWRLTDGERMLREHGIEKLPGQIFDEIKSSLAQSDAHFARFSPAAIKRCLLLFTENVLPQVPSLPATGNGGTIGRDFAHEAWVAAKQFKAMLTDGSPNISESTSSMAVEPPDSPAQEAELSTLTNSVDGPSPPASRMNVQDSDAAVAPPSIAPTASARGGRASSRGGTKTRGGSKASRGRGGKTTAPSRADSNDTTTASAATTSDNSTIAVDMFVRKSVSSSHPDVGAAASSPAPPAQPQKPTTNSAAPAQPRHLSVPPSGNIRPVSRMAEPSLIGPLDSPMDLDGVRDPSPFNLDEAPVHSPSSVPASNSSPTITPGLAAATSLGKHSRSQSDGVEEIDTRPPTIQKRQHEPSQNEPTIASEEQDRIDRGLDEMKKMMDREAERHRLVAASEEILAMEVNVLRERVRIFEQEKEEALEAQRRELRPGMVTMKMTPKVQQRVNQLFGTNAGGIVSGDGASAARARATQMIARGSAAMEVDDESPRSATLRRGLKRLSTSSQLQEPTPVDTPPMGVFRNPVPRGGNDSSSSNMASRKGSSGKESSSRPQIYSGTMDLDGDDSDDEPLVLSRARRSKKSSSKTSTARPLRSSGRMEMDEGDSGNEACVLTVVSRSKASRGKARSSKSSRSKASNTRPLRSSGRMEVDDDDNEDESYVPTGASRSKESSRKTTRSSGRMELDGHDSGEESYAPTESSWTSSIPP